MVCADQLRTDSKSYAERKKNSPQGSTDNNLDHRSDTLLTRAVDPSGTYLNKTLLKSTDPLPTRELSSKYVAGSGSASDSRARGPGFDTRSGHILSFLLPLIRGVVG